MTRPSRGRGRLRVTAVSVALLAMVAAGCGGPGGGGAGASPVASPPAGAVSSGDPAPATPRPTPWPGQVVLDVTALGAADVEIGKASTDLQTSIATEDLRLMRQAAAGLAGIDVLRGRLSSLESYAYTRPFGTAYREALDLIASGGRQVRDAIDTGDAKGIEAGNVTIGRGLAAYAALRARLSELVKAAMEQQRLLTQ